MKRKKITKEKVKSSIKTEKPSLVNRFITFVRKVFKRH